MFQQISSLLVAALYFLFSFIPQMKTMESFAADQIAPSIVYVPSALVTGLVKPKTSKEVEAVKARAGGYIKGICHPTDDYKKITDAGIEWDRADIPFPFEKNGKLRQSYIDWKARMKKFQKNGIKIFAVTPYPSEYMNYGLDPRLPKDEARIKEIAQFYIKDLKGIIGGIQVSNELAQPRFGKPLTLVECVRFIGIQLEAMYPIRGDVIIGYNTAGPQADQNSLMRPYWKYCDYVGLDMYLGCFTEFGNWIWIFDVILDYLWSMTGKPIIMAEFGYIGKGAPKTAAEKQAILQKYGVSSEEEARSNIKKFVSKLPESLREDVEHDASGDWGNFIFGSTSDFRLHLYRELPEKMVLKGYPHSPEGQAKFYTDILKRLEKKKYLIGSFIYCWADSERCYYCGQADCPIETGWGLVTAQGKEKPSYYAVQKAWAK